MKKVRISETVMFYDTDCGGVVSNIAYLRFVEKARTELFGAMGMGLVEMNKSRLFPAVVRTEINYRTPAILGDVIEVTAALHSVEKVRATCDFTLAVRREGEDARVAADARQIVVLVQMPSGKPRRMPSEWLSLCE